MIGGRRWNPAVLRVLTIRTPRRWLPLTGLLLSWCFSAHALQELHGSARLTGFQQESDQPSLRSWDQQFTLNYQRALLPAIRGNFGLSYRDLQTHQATAADLWHGELMPSANLTWSTPFFNAGGNYRYRQVRDFIAANEAISRGLGLSLKTKFVNLPQSQILYNWDRNSINSGFEASEFRQKRFQYKTDYSYKTAGIYYGYSHLTSDNLSTNTGSTQLQHTLRLDYSQYFFQDRRLRLSGDYLFDYRRNQQSTGYAQPAIQIPAILGLYAQDTSPGGGELDTVMTLIDDNLFSPTSPAINIGGATVGQNIGFDLGIPRQINMVYIYVDTLSDASLGWTIYTSSDNLSWTALAAGAVSLYNFTFRRYELSFSPTTARYFKAVNSGVNAQPEVLVTEIQAFLTSAAAQNPPSKSQNHRVSLNAIYQVHHNLQVGMDAAYGSLTEDLSGQERQESSLAGTASYHPYELISVNARAQYTATDYSGTAVPLQESDIYSLVFLSNPLPTMELSLSGSRYEIREDRKLTQINQSSLLHGSFLLIPGLSSTAEIGYSRNEQVVADNLTNSLTYRLAADANPYQSLTFNLNYSIQDYSSDLPGASGRRDNFSGHVQYRLTFSISLQGGLTYSRDQGQKYIEQDYALSWNMTERLFSSANVHLQDPDSGNHTRQYNLQSSYRVGNRTDLFASYSLDDLGVTSNAADNKTVAYQIGLNTGF